MIKHTSQIEMKNVKFVVHPKDLECTHDSHVRHAFVRGEIVSTHPTREDRVGLEWTKVIYPGRKSPEFGNFVEIKTKKPVATAKRVIIENKLIYATNVEYIGKETKE